MFLRFIAIISLLITVPVSAAFWTPANRGMQAWSFNDIIINPTNPQIIYASSMSGIFKSTNGGASWTAINTGLAASPYTLDIAMDPSNPNVLYAASQFAEGGRGVYKTTDGGANWTRKSTGIYHPYINSVNVFPGNTQILYAGTNVGGAGGGVYKSTNGGESWTYIAGSDLPASGMDNDAAPIVSDPVDSNYVYAGKNSYTGFLRSTDGGSHWTWGDNSFVIKHLVVHPADTNRIFAGGNGFLKISRNRGQSLTDTGLHFTIGGVAIAPSNTDIVYTGAYGNTIYKSTDRGDTWLPVGTEVHNWSALAVHPTDPNIIYAATTGEGILKSVNGGLTWSTINGGLPTQMRCTKMVSSMKYKTVFSIIDTRALYATYDDGNSWYQLMPVNGYPGDLKLAADDKTLYMANGDLYRSTDLGFNWSTMPVAAGHTIVAVAQDPNDAGRLFVYDDTDKTIRRTTDGGASWQIVTTLTPDSPDWWNIYCYDIEVDPSNSQRIYLATYNHPWRSEDGGNTWTILNGLEYNVNYGGSLKPTSFVRDITIDPVQPDIIYAATQWGHTWKSTNYGNTWTPLYVPQFDANTHFNVVLDPANHNTVYVSTASYGAYKSTNGGASWTQLIDGLSGSDTNVYRIVISPWNYSHVFAGSYTAGVYRGGGGPDIPTLSQAKGQIPDGGVFAFTSPQVVSSAMTDGAIYVQATDRSQGIRVSGAEGFQPGDMINLRGVMETESGERRFRAVELSKAGTTDIPKPLGVTNTAVGGSVPGTENPQIAGSAGVCNTGLLVKSTGKVTAVTGLGSFYIDDGSKLSDGSGKTGIRVSVPGTTIPAVGDYVSVTGASGASLIGSNPARLIRARSADDIQPRNYLTNAGFETGDVTGWTYAQQTGDVITSPWALGNIPSNCGAYFWGVATNGSYTPGCLYQRVQAPAGKSFHARTYSLVYWGQNGSAFCKNRIGIDPTGGTIKTSANVVWSSWDTQPVQWTAQWHEIHTPTVTPTGGYVTVFLDIYQYATGWHINCFDDAGLFAD